MTRTESAGPGGYFTAIETRAIVREIAAAEAGNRGEVRLHVEQHCKGDPVERARERFAELGMQHTEADTGVLLYIAISDRKAAVFAGQGVHGAAENGFWDEVVAEVANGFRNGEALTGLQNALELIGALLREHVPGEDSAGNELPNQVTTS